MQYKSKAYLITFFSYVGIHSLRTTYSFSKGTLSEVIETDQSQLGIVDSLMIYALALGFLQQAIFPFARPVRALAFGLFFSGVIYLFVPFTIASLDIHSFGLLATLMCLNGYVQSFAWPNLLMVVNSYYDNKEDAIKLGFWATNTNFGNIFGFIICEFIVLRNGLPWELSMYIVSIYLIFASILVSCIIEELNTKKPLAEEATDTESLLSSSESIQSVRSIASSNKTNRSNRQRTNIETTQELNPLKNVKKLLESPVVILMTVAFSLMKSIQYGILLWLPIYFDLKGLVNYSAYIPITFDSASIVSSIALGYFFTKISNKGLLLGPLILLQTILFFVLRETNCSVAGYFILIAGVGLCLGGAYNTMGSLVAIELVKVVPPHLRTKYLGFYSAVLMCAANFITATTQILIGYVVQKDEALIFSIFFWYSVVALLIFIAIAILEKYNSKEKNEERELLIQIVNTH